MNSDGRSPKQSAFSGGFPAWAAHALAVVTAAYTVLLVVATHYPKPAALVGKNPPSDKLLHFVAYGALGLLTVATLRGYGRWSRLNVGRLAAGLAVAGILDEATQPLFSRHADPLDWVFDCVGIAGGIVCFAALNSLASGRGSR